MTRAESQLFVTGALPPRTKEEREAMESENPDIMDRICQLAEKKSGNPASAEVRLTL